MAWASFFCTDKKCNAELLLQCGVAGGGEKNECIVWSSMYPICLMHARFPFEFYTMQVKNGFVVKRSVEKIHIARS